MNQEKDEILIAKRPDTKHRFPGKWDFGCGQLKTNTSFESCLIAAYKADFGIEIKVDPLRPFKTYLIEDHEEGRIIPGIIFLALIKDSSEIEKCFSKEKHTEIRWISEKNEQSLNPAEFTGDNPDDTADTIKQAFSVFKEWKKISSSINSF